MGLERSERPRENFAGKVRSSSSPKKIGLTSREPDHPLQRAIGRGLRGEKSTQRRAGPDRRYRRSVLFEAHREGIRRRLTSCGEFTVATALHPAKRPAKAPGRAAHPSRGYAPLPRRAASRGGTSASAGAGIGSCAAPAAPQRRAEPGPRAPESIPQLRPVPAGQPVIVRTSSAASTHDGRVGLSGPAQRSSRATRSCSAAREGHARPRRQGRRAAAGSRPRGDFDDSAAERKRSVPAHDARPARRARGPGAMPADLPTPSAGGRPGDRARAHGESSQERSREGAAPR